MVGHLTKNNKSESVMCECVVSAYTHTMSSLILPIKQVTRKAGLVMHTHMSLARRAKVSRKIRGNIAASI